MPEFIHLYAMSRKGKSVGMENRLVFAWLWRQNGEWLQIDPKAPFWGDGYVSKLDHRERCTTPYIYWNGIELHT